MKQTKICSNAATKRMLQFQKDEITSSIIYTRFAKRMKYFKNRKILLQIANDEKKTCSNMEKLYGSRSSP